MPCLMSVQSAWAAASTVIHTWWHAGYIVQAEYIVSYSRVKGKAGCVLLVVEEALVIVCPGHAAELDILQQVIRSHWLAISAHTQHLVCDKGRGARGSKGRPGVRCLCRNAIKQAGRATSKQDQTGTSTQLRPCMCRTGGFFPGNCSLCMPHSSSQADADVDLHINTKQ